MEAVWRAEGAKGGKWDMRYRTAIALLIGVSGCSPISEEEQIASEARSALVLVLKDPSSAQFTDLIRNEGSICGFVNAKNSMGAYSGFKAFLVRDGKALLDLGDRDAGFAKEFDARCPPELALKQINIDVEALTATLNATR